MMLSSDTSCLFYFVIFLSLFYTRVHVYHMYVGVILFVPLCFGFFFVQCCQRDICCRVNVDSLLGHVPPHQVIAPNKIMLDCLWHIVFDSSQCSKVCFVPLFFGFRLAYFLLITVRYRGKLEVMNRSQHTQHTLFIIAHTIIIAILYTLDPPISHKLIPWPSRQLIMAVWVRFPFVPVCGSSCPGAPK